MDYIFNGNSAKKVPQQLIIEISLLLFRINALMQEVVMHHGLIQVYMELLLLGLVFILRLNLFVVLVQICKHHRMQIYLYFQLDISNNLIFQWLHVYISGITLGQNSLSVAYYTDLPMSLSTFNRGAFSHGNRNLYTCCGCSLTQVTSVFRTWNTSLSNAEENMDFILMGY